MPPTQSALATVPPSVPSAKPPTTHHPSITAMVVLALFLSLMASMAIGVVLRQRKAVAAAAPKDEQDTPQEKQHPARATMTWIRSWFSRDRPASSPTAVSALHATSVLLAAAPCRVFSPPMTMHFRIPLEDKTILILGVPWFSLDGYGAQHHGDPAAGVGI